MMFDGFPGAGLCGSSSFLDGAMKAASEAPAGFFVITGI
jgi:hypothetical protein